jgi:pyrimidine deaminase RibD-like protein
MRNSRHPGVLGLISLLRNHYLIQTNELQRVENLENEFRLLEDDVNVERDALLVIFRELQSLAEIVIERELGSPLFEGVPLRWLERAVELAESSEAEDDGPRPKVGAVILKDELLLAEASRNQDNKGGHAEQIAIESCSDPRELDGSVVLTTLEPCTIRGSRGRRPCAELLLRFGVAKVLIGLPDPNPDIRGRGDLLFRKNGVTVGYFPSGLAHRLWALNSKFIAHHTADEFREVFLFRG